MLAAPQRLRNIHSSEKVSNSVTMNLRRRKERLKMQEFKEQLTKRESVIEDHIRYDKAMQYYEQKLFNLESIVRKIQDMNQKQISDNSIDQLQKLFGISDKQLKNRKLVDLQGILEDSNGKETDSVELLHSIRDE